ncbi:MAG: caspase family protein, partial [Nannocystaceae bacterium]
MNRTSKLNVPRPSRRRLIGAAFTTIVMLAASVAHAEAPDPVETVETVAPAAQKSNHYAIVIGTNQSPREALPTLRFADDDAARMAELLEESGATVTLLTTFDTESQALYPELVSRAKRPTLAAIQAAHADFMTRIDAGGGDATLTIYYSGHGDLGDDGREFLTLEQGRLTRHELLTELVGGSKATTNHLLIDACRSEDLVLSRGEGWKSDRVTPENPEAVREYLEAERLDAHPNTGVILASSGDQTTHEWERYRGGVFTHQLLSAMRGGGDINGDGRIEYSEVGAFVSAANRGVEDPRARLEVSVHPPHANQRTPLLIHEDLAEERVILFVGEDKGHYMLEDDRGVRIADLRRSDAHPAYLRVPDGPLYLARQDRNSNDRVEAKIPATRDGAVLVSELTYDLSGSRERGALADAFHAGLFRVGYGPSYYAGYTASEDQLAVEDPEWEVRRWTSSDGDTVEVIRLGERGDSEGPPSPPDCDCEDDDGKKEKKKEKIPKILWGQLTVGISFTPYGDAGTIQQGDSRVTSDQFAGFAPNGAGQAIRGFDARWALFDTKDKPRSFPKGLLYFRTGYTQGTASIVRSPGSPGFEAGDATGIDYFSIPLYLSGEFYAFEEFPVRPSFGIGFGLDLMNIEYDREALANTSTFDVGAGVELHAGLDIRINNYVGFMAEIRQQWSSRIKVRDLPDVSNTGLAITTGIRAAFPVKRYEDSRSWRKRRKKAKATATATSVTTVAPVLETPPPPPAPAPAPPLTPAPTPFPEPEAPS